MQKRVAEIFDKYGFKTKKAILAVSGGVDSVVLLDLALKIIPAKNLIVAHVNHGLRTEADRDGKFVEKLAVQNNLTFYSKKIKMIGKSEAEARQKRYQFLREVKEETKASYIITAHHLNDQLETILLNMVRGVGPLNFWGMREMENGILRPLLSFKKVDLINYAKKENLKWHEDKTNQNLNYVRNRIRNKVVPVFEEINPKFFETFAKEVEVGQKFETKLEKMVNKSEQKIRRGNTLDLKAFKKLEPVLQSTIIYKMLKEMVNKREVTSKNIEVVFDIMSKKGNKKTEIGGFTISKNYDKITFGHKAKKSQKNSKFYPGKAIVFNEFKIKSRLGEGKATKNNILLDPAIAYNLNIRTWKPGDRIITSCGTKKIQDIFVDAKISTEKRRAWPILVDKTGRIYWLPLLAASKEAKKSSKNSLIIEVSK